VSTPVDESDSLYRCPGEQVDALEYCEGITSP
jgi:hypothetical protein